MITVNEASVTLSGVPETPENDTPEIEIVVVDQPGTGDAGAEAAASAEQPASEATEAADPSSSRIVHEKDVAESTLQDLIRSRSNVVMLLGFPGAGKTWFLNRLKFELQQHKVRPYSCVPHHSANAEHVGRSNALTVHHFTPAGESRPGYESFDLIDMPGERFNAIARGSLSQRKRELLAIKAARAFIVVMPADEVLMGPRAVTLHPDVIPADEITASDGGLGVIEAAPGVEAKPRKKARRITPREEERLLASHEKQLQRFTNNMPWMRAILSLVELEEDVTPLTRLTNQDVIDHLKDKSKYKAPQKPVFVALSKADVIETMSAELADDPGKANLMGRLFSGCENDLAMLADFDGDPAATVQHFRSVLVTMMSAFGWCKFDFLTAFKGHVNRGDKATSLNYALPHCGVSAVIKWLEWAREVNTQMKPHDWRHIRVAKWLRRFRQDGLFPNARDGGYR